MKKGFKKSSVAVVMGSTLSKIAMVGGAALIASTPALAAKAVAPVESEVAVSLKRSLAIAPKTFHIESTSKVVIDLEKAKGVLSETPEVKGNPLVKNVVVKEVGSRTRLIFETTQPVKYEANMSGGKLTVKFVASDAFGSTGSEFAQSQKIDALTYETTKVEEAPAQATVVAATPAVTEAQVDASEFHSTKLTGMTDEEINSIINKVNNSKGNVKTTPAKAVVQSSVAGFVDALSFKKESGGVGRLTVTLSNNTITPVVTRSNNSLIIEMKNVAISQEMQKRVDTKKLGLPTQFMDISTQQNNGRIVLEQKEGWEFSVFQFGDKLTVEVKAKNAYDQFVDAENKKKGYTGKPFSLNFQSMDVRTVLQVIADYSKMNILASDAVKGEMTVRLQDVPWDQALDLILESKNLKKVQQGNVIWVATREEVTQKNEILLKEKEQNQKLDALKLEAFQLNHHKAEDVVRIIMGESGKGGSTLKILSDRGSASIDKRNNILFVQDTEANLVEVKKLLKKIDVTTRQVLIEAKIVLAKQSWGRSLGAKFGVSGSRGRGNTVTGLGSNWSDAVNNTNTALGGGEILTNPAWGTGGKAGSGSIGLTIFNIASGLGLGIELNALENNNEGQVLSSPRLLTTDNRKATIKQGTQIPYVKPGTANETATVEFKEANLELEVVPQIAPNGKVIMTLKIRKDSIGEYINVPGGGGQMPTIDTRVIDTEVTVNNGQTVVLGGVYELTNRKDAEKVPFLGNIPVLGNLFKQNSKGEEKAELLIFITPHVVEMDDLDDISQSEQETTIELKRLK